MYLDHNLAAFGTLPLVFGLGVAGYILALLGQAIYNVTLHPLARFPGPKLWAAFYWPHAWSTLHGNQARDLQRMHEKYEQMVRIEPWTLSSTDGGAWKEVYGSRPGKGQMPKYRRFFNFGKTAQELPPHIILANDADHSRYRRILAHAFSDQAIRSQEGLLNIYFRLLVEKLQEEVEGPGQGIVDMVAYYNFITFDIIGDLSFGESFAALEKSRYHPWIENTYKFVQSLRWLSLAFQYGPVRWYFQAMAQLRPESNARSNHFKYTDERIERRLNLETDRKDFMTYILRHNDEKGMSREEILSNVSVLMLAGTETTATLLSGVTYHLLRNPDKMARLQKEVRAAFDSIDDMTLLATNQLPYLHAVIEEGLRIYPPVPGILPRQVPPEGALVAGQWVPGGTVIGVHQLSAYRDGRNFSDPEDFVAERFLPDAPAKYAHDRRNALQPFSFGPRNCLGKNLAYNEMRSILARVVFQFDMELAPEAQNWGDQKAFTLWNKPPMKVELRSRKDK